MNYTVVFVANNNYIQHFLVALKSLLVNNNSCPFKIYLLNEGLSRENETLILETIQGYPVTFENIIVNEKLFENLHIGAKHLSIQTFFRLLIPQLLEEERVLYLDSDIVVTGSLIPLFEIDFEDNYVLAVKDTFNTYAEETKKKLGMSKESTYFNAGILVINTNKWREDKLMQRIIAFASENPTVISYADQDSINAIIDTKIKLLPLRYNIQFSLLDKSRKTSEEKTEIKHRCVVHYTGGYPYKPWFYACINPLKKEYKKYLKQTSFKDYKPRKDYIGIIKYKLLRPIYRNIKYMLQ